MLRKQARHIEAEKDVSGLEVSRLKTKSSEKLPKMLPAAVCAQYVRCGKSNCKCASGLLHGPYHYCFWREGGKLKKAYVRKADVAEVRSICQTYRQSRQRFNIDFDLWRSLQLELREVEHHVCANQV